MTILVELRDEIFEMAEKDQAARRQWTVRGDNDEESLKHVQEIDVYNTARMKEIVNEYGWPGTSLVGVEGSYLAWLLVQHADRDLCFQRRCLILLVGAVEAGEALPTSLGFLLDRVLVADIGAQVYGTQNQRYDDGTVKPFTIIDAANVNSRRSAIGLPPLNS